PLARAEFDGGRAEAATRMEGLSLSFAPSAAQRADLAGLLADQQNPASPLYHKWLTPSDFGARFGMSAHDLATAQAWLQAQGFVVGGVAKGRTSIQFSGTVGQVESAFHTEIHQYKVNGATHLANATAITLPASMAQAVSGVRNVAQFRPRPMHVRKLASPGAAVSPNYTASNGDHYLTPADITTIYDINALYNAGYTGGGQKIAILGQSAISTTDISAFNAAAGLGSGVTINQNLVPNTGASTVQSSSGDEDESEIDLEWAGAIAKGATLDFDYAGATGGVFDALSYAVDQDVDSILSLSYGSCELYLLGTDISSLEGTLMQANAQGQTVLASAGDQGSTTCEFSQDGTSPVTTAVQGLSVSYPASSAYVTAMGGTEFNEGSGNYWNTSNSSSGGSATSYIPEMAWNDTTVAVSHGAGLTSTGGGVSTIFGKPSYQTALTPSDGVRDLPDISLDAAVYHDGFLACTGGSCSTGFAGAVTNNSIFGGTSFDTPIFAGILAIINQKNGLKSSGVGNINPELYRLYGTGNAFHDITVGNNDQPCTSGSQDCPSGTTEIGYAAGPGYDLATGLGSIDANNLATIFPASPTITSGSLTATVTTIASLSPTPVAGAALTLTASVAGSGGSGIPTGTITVAVNGGAGTTLPLQTTVGTAGSVASTGVSFSTAALTAGSYTITASYSGDGQFAASSSSFKVTVVDPTTLGGFSIAATNMTVTAGATGNSTLTITSKNNYHGLIGISLSTTSTTLNGCYTVGEPYVTSNGTTTTTLSFDTSPTCGTSGAAKRAIAHAHVAGNGKAPLPGGSQVPVAAAAALLACLGMLGWKRKSWPMMVVLWLAALGTLSTLSGCGSSSGGGKTTGPSGTSYTLTVTGTDNSYSTITASTNFTLTIQ
ncbi:MAG TPA: protease pro-enzyme activation domain-containing protein, partial [Acidobacteriaceae bacterium]